MNTKYGEFLLSFFFSPTILAILVSCSTNSRQWHHHDKENRLSLFYSRRVLTRLALPPLIPWIIIFSLKEEKLPFIYLFIWLAALFFSAIPPLVHSQNESRSRFFPLYFSRFIVVWEGDSFFFVHLESTPTGRQTKEKNRISLESMTKREKKRKNKKK